jgi:(p)ppGpp synthase/HD superfamily hydrolase
MTTISEQVQKAFELATWLHATQKDKAGLPYILHPQRVAERVRLSGGTWVQEAAAWLHDSVEDTDATFARLEAEGIASSVIELVFAMTKHEHETIEQYYSNIKQTPGAILIKLCDIYDNLDPARLAYLDVETRLRLRRKYAKALVLLTEE